MEAAVLCVVVVIILVIALFPGTNNGDSDIRNNNKEFQKDRVEKKQ